MERQSNRHAWRSYEDYASDAALPTPPLESSEMVST